jgi:DNA invertase Pin-like site-specific DNA recombinase
MSSNGHLRVGGYCRTSGEGQRDNTSILSQKEDIGRLVKSHGWKLIRHYVDECRTGSKIAGRDAFVAMMKDAAAGEFDLVVFFDVSRFGRDGLDILNSARTLKRDFGVDSLDTKGKFDTRDRRRNVINFLSAGMAEDERLSILERTKKGKVRRARETGGPLGSKWPFGRVWNKVSRTWSLDPVKAAQIQDVARRYLAGEGMEALAIELGVNQSGLHRVLTTRSGPVWVQRVQCPELGIDEAIETAVPPLLDEETIAAVRARSKANHTLYRGQLKYPYLLSHVIFCGYCGLSLSGQHSREIRYYRHHHRRVGRQCSRRLAWVNAQQIEDAVLAQLFECFGNPRRVAAAARAAYPDAAKLEAERTRLERLTADLGKVGQQRERLVDGIADGLLSREQAKRKLDELAAREAALADEARRIAAVLKDTPSAGQVLVAAEEILKRIQGIITSTRADDYSTMSWDEKRFVVQMVFSGDRTPEGEKLGVYVCWPDEGSRKGRGKGWAFTIKGKLSFTSSGVTSDTASLPHTGPPSPGRGPLL